LQSQIDEAYDQFVSVVVSGRAMSEEQVRILADGRTYTAKQALGHGLIDGIVTEEEYDNRIAEETEVYNFYEPDFTSFSWSFLSGMLKSGMDSDTKTLVNLIKDCENKGGRLYVKPLQ
ncbi:MAG: S49 family peptidase, partial [Clostridia bacterium]|nr:S49 family peptidase [Clostridia bacterium]